MPSKIRPDDWDRLFAPNAPRRGGPLRVLANILLALLVLGLIGGGATFLIGYRQQQTVSQNATVAAFQTLIAPGLTASAAPTATTAAQLTATRYTIQTATVAAARGTVIPTIATPIAGLGIGVVTTGGNLRSEPRIADETIVGLIWPGDEVAFVEQREVSGQIWIRIQVLSPASSRGGEGVPAGSDGWASATLLSPPTPAP